MTTLSVSKILPVLVLACGLSATWFLQRAALSDAYRLQHENFNYQSREIALRIEQRLAAYEQVLRGTRGLFAASKSVERDEFQAYVETLRLSAQYPGIQGIGFSLIVRPQDKAAHIAALRKEGFPLYQIKPAGLRELYTSIIYLEPFKERNLRAFGYDMYSEALRRFAMEQARDLNQTFITGKVKLLQETDKNVQPGFLMVLPVYRNGSPHETVAERRATILGWVYAPFRMNDLMQGVLGAQAGDADLEIYQGTDKSPETLMYDSVSEQRQADPLYKSSRRIDIYGQNWFIDLHSLPLFEAKLDQDRVVTIRLVGVLLSALLALLIWQLARGRATALKLAQQMTREFKDSEYRWKFAVEGSGDGLWDWDVAKGSVFFSKCWKEMLGYGVNEVGNGLSEWEKRIHPDDKSATLATVGDYLDGKTPVYQSEHRVLCKDGSYKWILDRGMVVERNAEGAPQRLIGTHTDITQRKQSEAKFRALFDQSSFMAGILDQQGRLLEVNNTALNFIDVPRAQLIGKYFPDTPWWENAAERAKLIAILDQASLGFASSFETTHVSPLGVRINMMVSAMPIFLETGVQVAVIGVDISPRIHAEALLRESESRFRMMSDSAPVLIWMSGTDKQCNYFNKVWLNFTGRTLEQEMGEGWTVGVHAEDIKLCLETYISAFDARLEFSTEYRLRRHDGEYRWIFDHGVPRCDEQGVFLGYIGTCVDVTDHKEYEMELKRSNTELEQFSYAISHDLRQPLRMISSYLQLLEMSLTEQLEPEKRDYFNFAIEGAKRIDQMLVALLEYSRVGRMGEPFAWIDSRAVLDEALQYLQPALTEAGAQLEIMGDWPRIYASRDEILRLLQNLISNAAKYRVAGRIQRIVINSAQLENEWHLSISDNGVGIATGQINRLFQVFQRLHSRDTYEGTGIGLALCRKIAEHHRGRIWAESPGQQMGSKFCVALPVLREHK